MKTLFLKDSSNRKKEFALTTKICVENGKKVVVKESCFPEGIPHLKRIVESQSLFAKYYKNVGISKTWIEDDKLYAEFIDGIQLSDLYIKAIQKKDKEEIIKLIRFHLEIMLGQNNACTFRATNEFAEVFGETSIFDEQQASIFTFFEASPENIIFLHGKNDRPYFIDYEWFFDFPIPVDIQKFRIAQQLSFFTGFDDIISLKDMLKIIGCKLSFNTGMILLNKFFDYVYKEKSINYVYLNKNFEKSVLQYPNIVTYYSTLYFDTGNGYSEEKKIVNSFTENEIYISCQIPDNTKFVRLDPIEGYGCVVSNLEILSYGGIVNYEPVNGYKDKNDNLVFINTDPQIELKGAAYWIKIKYRIMPLSDFSHYRVFDNFIAERDNMITERDSLIVERDNLATDRIGLISERDCLIVERNNLTVERDGLLNSRSWRITKPLRDLAAFVRRHKMLRLFAKGLLSLKRNGIIKTVRKTVTYKRTHRQEPLSSLAPGTLSYESEYQENIDFSKYEPKVKAIAFYLPQFHAIPENDKWWGKGFTEWTNTRKAKPRFNGHYQPREPHDDFGYYNLTNIDIIKKQALLAKQHGIYGFCFYFYWFSGKRLLEKPLDLFLEHPEIDINFCLCWANENWTRRWDGLDNEILMKQNYSDDDPFRFIEDIRKYITDKRYIRIDGVPIILVYNPGHISNVKNVFIKWLKYANEIGIGKIKILVCKTFGETPKTLDIEDFVDGMVEFPPHGIPPISAKNIFPSGENANVYDYKELVIEIKEELKYTEKNASMINKMPIYHTCMLGWDNAARKKDGWAAFAGFSLDSFYGWASLLATEALRTQNPFFFINAWNEWAEGTYLEPDKKYGYACINTFSKAIFDLPLPNRNPIKQREIKRINGELIENGKIKICVQVHLYYLELLDEIVRHLNFIPFPFHCYISTGNKENIAIIENEFKKCKNADKVYIELFENRGRDAAPFICQMKNIINKYDYILHIHTKKSLTSDAYGDDWREYLFNHLLGSTENIYHIFGNFINKKNLGLISPEIYPAVKPFMLWGTDIEQGKQNVLDFLKRVGIVMDLGNEPVFAAGNMFWARTKAIKKAFNAGITQDDFPAENNQKDMTLAHAIERSWVYIAKNEGYTFEQINLKEVFYA